MNKNQAQLYEDTGVIVGQICDIDVISESEIKATDDGKRYCLEYSDNDKCFFLVELNGIIVSGQNVIVAAPAGGLVDTKAYNLVFSETDGTFTLTEVV